MSKNIKDIGKELMGKSLNSFHRKTGLTQLEKNNEMQDGILNGILSQVDDAYIEKTEQSNVIHLEGSGDGVVVVDGIEGNTIVNLSKTKTHTTTQNPFYDREPMLQVGKTYTISYDVILSEGTTTPKGVGLRLYYTDGTTSTVIDQPFDKGHVAKTFTVEKQLTHFYIGWIRNAESDQRITLDNITILEGINEHSYFEGMKSSFEEKVNDQDKYEIEILSRNKNLFDGVFDKTITSTHLWSKNYILVEPNTQYIGSHRGNSTKFLDRVEYYDKDKNLISFQGVSNVINTPSNCKYIKFRYHIENQDLNAISKTQIEKGNIATEYEKPKQNKIKLLLNSPLLKGDEIVCKEDGLYHYHKMGKVVLDGSDSNVSSYTILPNSTNIINAFGITLSTDNAKKGDIYNVICDRFSSDREIYYGQSTIENIIAWADKSATFVVNIAISKLPTSDVEGFRQWLQANPITVVYELAEPYYEKITNEYGEPIIMEGYENGTIYIDSTIVPTTTVRYTPKMESFKTLKEVKIRNTINDFDVANNVIPYMMEVDIKLTELEMSAISTYNIKNIRKMEVLDMISMQERTFKMLERLIRGKSHTKQEMIDRVLLYEQAGRITTEQALELNLVIEEVYGA